MGRGLTHHLVLFCRREKSSCRDGSQTDGLKLLCSVLSGLQTEVMTKSVSLAASQNSTMQMYISVMTDASC